MEINYINFEKVIASPDFSSVVKMTAMQLQKNPYMTLGDFFINLSNNDMSVLNLMVELAMTGDEQSLSDIIILSGMLAQAEGTDSHSIKENVDTANIFCTMIACESLKRKGLVDVNYDLMSFGADMDTSGFAKIKDM